MNIPDDAVDAAADPIYDCIENLGGTDLEMARNIAYSALRAAGPLLVSAALRDLAEDEGAFYLATWLRDRANEMSAK